MPQDMVEGQYYGQRTKMPTYVESEPPFIVWQELKISLRQVLTLFFGLVIWYIFAKVTVGILPFSTVFGFLIWGWVPLGAGLLAFGKKKGMPLEQYIADSIMHRVSPQLYVPMDDAYQHGSVDETLWEDD
jgi:hypothetical protein